MMEYKEFKAETLTFLKELSNFPRDQREEAMERLLKEFEGDSAAAERAIEISGYVIRRLP